MVILDTNIIIDHLRQGDADSTVLSRAKDEFGYTQLHVSPISVQELYAGKSTHHLHIQQHLAEVIDLFIILPYTRETAILAGSLARDSKRPLKFADAAIAATALTHDAQLLTLNTKDFAGISDLKLLKL